MLLRSLRSAPRAAIAAGVILAVAGCQPGVREDRSITFSPDGRAAFQHGENGVFVTDSATGKPKRIYESRAGDLAVSPPIWAPTGGRIIFTVARSANDNRYERMGDAPADGRRYAAVPVRYSCLLYDPATGGSPEKLFETRVDHIGYVAAGLAVCWHPDGKGLDFVEQTGPKQHRVRTFDLTARRAEMVSLPCAEHIVLGSAPGKPFRFALLGGAGGDSGLWVEGAAGGWWLVPSSVPETAHLEDLRRRLPQWSRDGKKLAFVDGPTIRVCDTATRLTESWHYSDHPLVESSIGSYHRSAALHWHPDGTRVGLIDGNRLGLVGPGGFQEVTESPVVSFAGWDASGRRMAYATAEPLPYAGAPWAAMFVWNDHARSAVLIADADGRNPRKTASSGVRATFLNWSPTEPRLSVWLTVEPPYRLVEGGRLGMPPGDPAALIDPDTGALEWLPVNGTEHAQIGHIDLRMGRLDSALRRFDEAAAALPPNGKADWMFFRAIALQKAGRDAAARDAWQRFEPPTLRERSEGDRARDRLLAAVDPRIRRMDGDAIRPRHRFVAEAFVSLDMATEAIDYFLGEVRAAASDRDRLSATVVLCQLLLLADRKTEYAEQVVNQLLPLAGRILHDQEPDQRAISGAVALTILPLSASEFITALPQGLARRVSEAMSAWPHTTRLISELNLGDKIDLEVLMRIRFEFLAWEQVREMFGELLPIRR